MVPTEMIKVKDLFNLRKRRTKRVRNRGERINPDVMILIYIIDMVRGIPMSATSVDIRVCHKCK